MIRERINAYSAEYGMLPPGCRVLCACSGGADSTALLHFLSQTPGLTVACAHFNHRLRGAESDRDEAFVKELCKRFAIECFCGSGDVKAFAAERHMSIEQAARTLRYQFLDTIAETHGFDRIATAHQAEDNAETVLLNLTRGSAMRGLCGIPPVRGKIIRPMLHLTRREILEYLNNNGLTFVEDSSNTSDDCTRNRIRHQVMPLLTAENPKAVEHICETVELLRRDEEYLSLYAQRFLEAELRDGALPIKALMELPQAIGSRVLRQTLGQLSNAHIKSVLDLCQSREKHGYADLPGRRLEKDGDWLILSAREKKPLMRYEIAEGDTILPEIGLRIIRRRVQPDEEIHNSFNTFFFQYDLIRDRIFVASRSPGDRIRLLGRGCTKTLKKLFSESDIPLPERDRIPVFYDADGVIAVAGFGIAERCAANTWENAECIEIKEMLEA